MKYTERLKALLSTEIIPDLEEAIDDIFSSIERAKMASIADKEELKDFQEMHSECKDIVDEIDKGEMGEEEAKEIYLELLDAKTLD